MPRLRVQVDLDPDERAALRAAKELRGTVERHQRELRGVVADAVDAGHRVAEAWRSAFERLRRLR